MNMQLVLNIVEYGYNNFPAANPIQGFDQLWHFWALLTDLFTWYYNCNIYRH